MAKSSSDQPHIGFQCGDYENRIAEKFDQKENKHELT